MRSRTERNLLSLLLLSIFSTAATAQEESFDFSNLSISNQFEYAIEKETADEIVEDWFRLDYQTEVLSFGARYETFQPSEKSAFLDPDDIGYVPPHTTFEGFTFRYLEFQRDGIQVTAGNFYDLFGRGIAFRSYENRDVRIDNSLDGIRVKVRRGIFDGTYMTGKMLEKDVSGISQERKGLLHAANFEARLSDRFRLAPLEHLLLGTSFVRQELPVSLDPQASLRREIATGRMEAGISGAYLYGEYGERLSGPGSALYLGSNLDFHGLGLSLEYKRYDRFALRTANNQVDYNNPPALSREHTFTLLSRNAWVMNVNDEKGYQVEATYSPLRENTLIFNFSHTTDLEGNLEFEEFYGEWSRSQGEWLYMVLAYGSQTNVGIRSLIPILELQFFLDERNSIRTELQHQHEKATFLGEFDVDLLVAEYSRSPRWTFSFIGERNNMSDLQRELQQLPDKDIFVGGLASIHLSDSHDLMAFFGSRQKGKVCVGGVCRTEPEFEGFEVKLFSKF